MALRVILLNKVFNARNIISATIQSMTSIFSLVVTGLSSQADSTVSAKYHLECTLKFGICDESLRK